MEPDTVSNNVTGSLLVCKKKLKIPMYSSASLGADSTGQTTVEKKNIYLSPHQDTIDTILSEIT